MLFHPCIMAPVFNHGTSALRLANAVKDLGLTLILVDDGSNNEWEALDEAQKLPHVVLIRHKQNRGKGGAVKTGLLHAYQEGFTHCLQIDSDGQHDAHDIPRFLKEAAKAPQSIICGYPVYDDSVPRGRLIGRYITHVWVWIETLSLQIRDSMCGFRVYPLLPTITLLNHVQLGDRMDFDPEILVRLHWADVQVRSLPTKVTYPPGALSNFRLWADNWLITCMHTRLFFGMLIRCPKLVSGRVLAALP